MEIELLPTRAKTAYGRRCELESIEYRTKYHVKLGTQSKYEEHLIVSPLKQGEERTHVRTFNDGLEAILSIKGQIVGAELIFTDSPHLIIPFEYPIVSS